MSDLLGPFDRLKAGAGIARSRVREWLGHDSRLFRSLVAYAGAVVGLAFHLLGDRYRAFMVFSRLHRFAPSHRVSRRFERVLGSSRGAGGAGGGRSTSSIYPRYVEALPITPATEGFFRDPGRLLGSRAIVLKSPGENERGVILIDYSFAFPLFARLYDVERIARRYHLVLEPSWSGYCTPEILSFCRFDFPVFVESIEPADTGFLRSLGSNLVPVPVAGNWWVDHRIFRPIPGARKDTDLIVISSWGHYKRHNRLFSALATLRKKGTRPSVILAGYPWDRTREDVLREAKYYGVRDQLEVHEWAEVGEVNALLNRSRANLLWSRKEGFNRAVIEGLFAGVPCILREGHNFGHKYSYINEKTGCFADEATLPEAITRMLERADGLEPRGWAIENISCQAATRVLGDSIREVAEGLGEAWTRDLSVKTVHLHGMDYWDPADAALYEPDYAFLRASMRPAAGAAPRPAFSLPTPAPDVAASKA
jgi:glycosyltransferase involved in cell wall biosynthesis